MREPARAKIVMYFPCVRFPTRNFLRGITPLPLRAYTISVSVINAASLVAFVNHKYAVAFAIFVDIGARSVPQRNDAAEFRE